MKYILLFTKQLHQFSGKVLYVNLLGMTLVSVLEGIGILLLIPLLSLSGFINLGRGSSLIPSWLSNDIPKLPPSFSLLLILAFYFLLMVGQNLFKRHQTMLNAKIQQGFLRYLKVMTYKGLIYSNWEFFLKRRKSDITNIMTMEISRVGGGVFLFLQSLSSLIFTLIQVGLALLISLKMTLFVLVFGVGLLFFSRSFIRRSNNLGKNTVALSQTYVAGITDHFNGIKDIKSNSLEESHLSWFTSVCEEIEDNIINILKLKSISQTLYKVVSSFLIVCFIYFAIRIFRAEPAQLMLIIVIFSRLWPRFTTIQSNLEQLSSLIPSFYTIMEVQKECLASQEIKDDSHRDSNMVALNVKNGIDCVDVSFRYRHHESVYALHKINLHIPANNMTAVVGRSGAGKSTLIDILMGLNKPEEGMVLIDGVPLSEKNLISLRRSISYVPQEPFLFNTSIRENLTLIEQNATDTQLWEALDFASATDFVRKLPQGLDTLIGDRGIKLSGGERQRIVLARAILRKPSILILDEATSSLDTENERRIQDALEKLKGSMTVIVIAHRLSTIRAADQVVVLEHGKIIQKGGFRQLASEKSGIFSHLLGQQMELTK